MTTRGEAHLDHAEGLVGETGVLVVLEPLGADGVDVDASLVWRAGKLADALGCDLRAVTWPAGTTAGVESLASGIAGVVLLSAPRIVLFGHSVLGRQLAPMLAFDMGTSAVLGCSDLLAWDGGVVYVKPVHGDWLARHLTFAPGYLQVATVRPFALAPGLAGQSSTLETIELELNAGVPDITGSGAPVRTLELVRPDPETVDVVHAERIVGVGSGAVSAGLLDVVQELAVLLQSSVGATRPVVDDGQVTKDRLIGQTGKVVAPDLYLALGISGSPHHLAGIQSAGEILAVDRDGHAPIHAFSDTGFVGDLAAVLPELLRLIRQRMSEESVRDVSGA